MPGESHGQRNLPGYSRWGHKESGRTQGLSLTCHLSDGETEALEWLPGLGRVPQLGTGEEGFEPRAWVGVIIETPLRLLDLGS